MDAPREAFVTLAGRLLPAHFGHKQRSDYGCWTFVGFVRFAGITEPCIGLSVTEGCDALPPTTTGAVLPLYYFQLRDGTDTILDPEAAEMVLEAVAAKALWQARDCIAGDVKGGRVDLPLFHPRSR